MVVFDNAILGISNLILLVLFVRRVEEAETKEGKKQTRVADSFLKLPLETVSLQHSAFPQRGLHGDLRI